MFSLLLLGGLAACSDDNNGNDTPEPEPSTYPTTPFSKIELKEVIESDAQPVTATHTYLYNSAGRLTSYTGKQSFTAGDELFEIENTTTVEYKAPTQAPMPATMVILRACTRLASCLRMCSVLSPRKCSWAATPACS